MRAIAFLLLLAAPGWPQFSELTTTDDGAQLYFTSTLQWRNNAAPSVPEYRLYRYTGRIELFQERKEIERTYGVSRSDGVRDIQVTGDGQTVGYSLYYVCAPSVDVCDRRVVQSELRGKYAQVLGERTLTLSRNGQWALLRPLSGLLAPDLETPVLINLRTGERTPTPPVPFGLRWVLASDGTVLVQQSNAIGLWKQGQFRPLPSPITSDLPGISDDGQRLLFTRSLPALVRTQLISLDVSSLQETVLVTSKVSNSVAVLGMSNDGRRVLCRGFSAQQSGPATLIDVTTGESRTLLQGEAVRGGTLSGNARVAYLLTTAGSIVKIDGSDRFTDNQTTIVPATPFVTFLQRAVPGSLTRLLATQQTGGGPFRGRILLGGVTMPILGMEEEQVLAQVPWELESVRYTAPLRVEGEDSGSAFLQSDLVPIESLLPLFEPSFRFIREDFSGVLDGSPQPGQIVHAYMTGLGPVQGTIATGQPAPLNRPVPITGQFTCQFDPHDSEAETLFAGLAPGMIGVYQVTFRMPPSAGAKLRGGSCLLNDFRFYITFLEPL